MQENESKESDQSDRVWSQIVSALRLYGGGHPVWPDKSFAKDDLTESKEAKEAKESVEGPSSATWLMAHECDGRKWCWNQDFSLFDSLPNCSSSVFRFVLTPFLSCSD